MLCRAGLGNFCQELPFLSRPGRSWGGCHIPPQPSPRLLPGVERALETLMDGLILMDSL